MVIALICSGIIAGLVGITHQDAEVAEPEAATFNTAHVRHGLGDQCFDLDFSFWRWFARIRRLTFAG